MSGPQGGSASLVGCHSVWWFVFFKQKTAYEIKECGWSSDVCSSDLGDYFFEFDARAFVDVEAFAQSVGCSNDEVVFIRRDVGVGADEFEASVWFRLKGQIVVKRDCLKDGL